MKVRTRYRCFYRGNRGITAVGNTMQLSSHQIELRAKDIFKHCYQQIYAPQIWSPYQISLIDAIEGIQRSFTKRLPGFANKSYAERLHLLHLQSLEHRRLLFDLFLCFNIVRGFTALSFNDFFSLSQNTSTRGHTFKLVVPIAKTNSRKYFFSSRIVPIWNSLPQQFVSAPSTAKFKSLITIHDLSFFLNHPTYIK